LKKGKIGYPETSVTYYNPSKLRKIPGEHRSQLHRSRKARIRAVMKVHSAVLDLLHAKRNGENNRPLFFRNVPKTAYARYFAEDYVIWVGISKSYQTETQTGINYFGYFHSAMSRVWVSIKARGYDG